jgi:hypothetical protein
MTRGSSRQHQKKRVIGKVVDEKREDGGHQFLGLYCVYTRGVAGLSFLTTTWQCSSNMCIRSETAQVVPADHEPSGVVVCEVQLLRPYLSYQEFACFQ